MADGEIGEALELLWGTTAVNTWNTRRAGGAVLARLVLGAAFCEGPAVPVWAKRLAVPYSETLPHSRMAIEPARRPSGGAPAGEDAVADAV